MYLYLTEFFPPRTTHALFNKECSWSRPNTASGVRKVNVITKKLLLIELWLFLPAAADPTSLLPGSLGSWCHEHDTMHERLDIIEEVRAAALVPGVH